MTTTTKAPASDNPRDNDKPAIAADAEMSAGPGADVILAHQLTGYAVVTPADEKLGVIEGIMLDIQSGRIAYAVLSFGGFLGMGDKLFAIPWTALTLDLSVGHFILNVSKADLERAPGFDRDHWPAMSDSQWATQVHGFYDVVPYWRMTERSSQIRF